MSELQFGLPKKRRATKEAVETVEKYPDTPVLTLATPPEKGYLKMTLNPKAIEVLGIENGDEMKPIAFSFIKGEVEDGTDNTVLITGATEDIAAPSCLKVNLNGTIYKASYFKAIRNFLQKPEGELELLLSAHPTQENIFRLEFHENLQEGLATATPENEPTPTTEPEPTILQEVTATPTEPEQEVIEVVAVEEESNSTTPNWNA